MNETAERPRLGLRGWLKRIAARIALLCGSLLFVFLLAEIGLRIAGAAPRTPTVISGYFQYHPRIGWAGRPDAENRFVSSEFDVSVAHDADGFRQSGLDTRIADDAQSDVRTVWCVGDSLTWGWGVEDGKTWVDHLNQKDADRRYRNLGAPGYSTLQEYLLLREHLEAGTKPGAVLLLFCHNDAAENVDVKQTRPYIVVDGKRATIENESVERRFGKSLDGWLVNHSLAYNYLRYYWAAAKQLRQVEQAPENLSTSPLGASAPIESAQRVALDFAIGKIHELCKQNDVTLWIATPNGEREPTETGEALGIPVFEVGRYLKTFEAGPSGTPTRFERDPHWNDTGNRIVAEALLEQIRAVDGK